MGSDLWSYIKLTRVSFQKKVIHHSGKAKCTEINTIKSFLAVAAAVVAIVGLVGNW